MSDFCAAYIVLRVDGTANLLYVSNWSCNMDGWPCIHWLAL